MSQRRQKSKARWVILLLASVMSLGNYYCIDLPQSLQTVLIQGRMGLSYKEYNLLFTIYSLPNVLMSILGGILIDRIGTRLVLLFFISLLWLSHVVVLAGFYLELFWLVLLGRFVILHYNSHSPTLLLTILVARHGRRVCPGLLRHSHHQVLPQPRDSLRLRL